MPTYATGPALVETRADTPLAGPLASGMPQIDVATLPDGRIMVLRDGAGVNPDGSGIGGFFLDNTGAVIADSGFAISQFAAGAQTDPDVAVLADGGFVAVWTSQNQDGFGGGIYGRMFNADGSPRGDEFQVSDTAPVDQLRPSVRALPGEGFVVGWAGDATVQYFDAAGAPRGAAIALDGFVLFEDLWVNAQGHVIALARTVGGDAPGAPEMSRSGLSQWVIEGPDGPAPVRVWLDPNPDPSGNFNDMSVTLFDLGDGQAIARYYTAAGARFIPSSLMVSLLNTQAPDFMRGVLPGQLNLSYDSILGLDDTPDFDASFIRLATGNLLSVHSRDGSIVTSEYRFNHLATGEVMFSGPAFSTQVLTADLSTLADADGLGALSLQWRLDGRAIEGATAASLDITDSMIGGTLSLMVRWTDGAGVGESVVAVMDRAVSVVPLTLSGTAGDDVLIGASGDDTLDGGAGHDRLYGAAGSDFLYGRDGADTLNGGAGDDFIFGGSTDADLRDLIYGGDGHDHIDSGAGNDEVYGGAGHDTVIGGLGADTLIGNAGNDLIAGSGGADLIFGNDGNDFLNGGYGSDRLSGGAGADSFFHQGVAGHGSDWIQDYTALQGDRLVFGDDTALASQFQVTFADTPGAGSAAVAEAFVIYRPTGQILWALVDGAAQHQIWLSINGELHGLL